MKKLVLGIVMAATAFSAAGVAPVSAQAKVTLVLGSWRTEDVDGYGKILAIFNKENPNIEVKFSPTLNTEYDAQLKTALQGGQGPDLITCRPYDISLLNYQAGFLTNVKDLPGLSHYTDVAKGAWATDNGDAQYCVPMGGVIHGFIYNQDIFDKVGVKAPTTESEFFAVLDKIKAAGITPLDITTKDSWTTPTMGFENIGVNFWDGENGRKGLISGKAKVTDPSFVAALTSLAKWQAYMPDGQESIGYADAQQIFPLGKAAIYPSGSWEIPLFESQATFKMAAFKPYIQDNQDPKSCWIDDHVDIAIGANAKSAHPDEVKTFLNWLTTQEFAQAFADNQPGFFPLADYKVDIKDPLAAQFLSWRQSCKSSIRVFYQFLGRGNPSGINLMNDNVTLMMQGKAKPADVAKTIQAGLDQWFKPMAQ